MTLQKVWIWKVMRLLRFDGDPRPGQRITSLCTPAFCVNFGFKFVLAVVRDHMSRTSRKSQVVLSQ